jgi:hypothetical protein
VTGLMAGNPPTGQIVRLLIECVVLTAVFAPLTARLMRRA